MPTMTPKHPSSQIYEILFVVEQTKQLYIDIYIYTNSLNNIYLLLNHIKSPSFQYNHPNKLLITRIVNICKTLSP